MKRIVVLPARAGSKRIKSKNIIDFCGKPMISHTLDALKKTMLFDVIHVSTDGPEIADCVRSLGFDVPFMRPSEFSDDHAPVLEVVRYVMKRYQELGKSFDTVAMVMPCSPLISSEDYALAVQLFENNDRRNSVLSVCEYPSPPEWAFAKNEKGVIQASFPEKLLIRSQDLKKSYFDTGNFCVFHPDQVLNSQSSVLTQFLPLVLPFEKSVDIDGYENLKFAEKLYRISAPTADTIR